MLAKMIFGYGLSDLSRLGRAVVADPAPRVFMRRFRQSAAQEGAVQTEPSAPHHSEHFTAVLLSKRR